MLDKIKIQSKLILLAGIPMSVMIALAIFSALQMHSNYQIAVQARYLGDLVVALGKVAHELQRERGMSSGLIASKGTKFADELPSQRGNADSAINTLHDAIQAIDRSKVEPRFQKLLAGIAPLLIPLDEKRQQINNLSIQSGESFRFYSDVIANLLEVAAQTSNQMPTAKISRLANAKSALLYLKERNGQERALLSGVFAAGQISPAEFNTWLMLLGDQSNYQRIVISFASPEQNNFLNEKLAAPVVKEVEQIEQMVRNQGPGVKISYPAEAWFEKITAKIDLLHIVEDHFSADIYAEIYTEAQLALDAFFGFLSTVIGAIILTIGAGWVIVRGILRQMGGEPAFAALIAKNIATGKLDNEIPLRKNDRHSFLASLKDMQQQLRERIDAERKLTADSLRIQSALDKTSTNMMVADNDGKIIYMNSAVTQMIRNSESDIRKDLPHFRAETVLGRNFDEFHKNPAHQRALLNQLQSVHRAEIKMGGRTFRLVVNPVINEKNERLGSVVEWVDRTDEVKAELELARILDAAVRGDFTTRLAVAGKKGFFLEIAEGMNRLIEIVATGLNDIAQVLNGIATGDLTRRITTEYLGTFGQLKDDTNVTVTRLTEIVGQIKEAADAIGMAVSEIAMGNSDLSNRTEKQAHSLEKAAASMDEINTTMRQNANNAQQANDLARSAHETIQSGGKTVKAVVTTMSEIQDASKKIADIIGMIDAISFQTNILALNAAVEAARAGEQGRGFAVVAAEVRNLAQRSAHAAKEIKELIANSVEKINLGAQLARQAGIDMDQVVTSFHKVNALVTEIAKASREQSVDIEQVTKAVAHMDEATQQNASLVEQAAAAAESLEDQVRNLTHAVAVFKLS